MFAFYNDWLANSAHYPIARSARVPARTSTRPCARSRVAKLGLRGVEMSCSWDMERCITRCGSRLQA